MASFNRRKKQIRMWSTIGHIIDLTNPSLFNLDPNARIFNRSNRSIPVVIAPWEGGEPVTEDATTGITKDICEQGVGVILPQPFKTDQVLVGFWPPASHRMAGKNRPTFVVGSLRHNVQIGGGFWQLGIQFTELADQTETAGFPVSRIKSSPFSPL